MLAHSFRDYTSIHSSHPILMILLSCLNYLPVFSKYLQLKFATCEILYLTLGAQIFLLKVIINSIAKISGLSQPGHMSRLCTSHMNMWGSTPYLCPMQVLSPKPTFVDISHQVCLAIYCRKKTFLKVRFDDIRALRLYLKQYNLIHKWLGHC